MKWENLIEYGIKQILIKPLPFEALNILLTFAHSFTSILHIIKLQKYGKALLPVQDHHTKNHAQFSTPAPMMIKSSLLRA